MIVFAEEISNDSRCLLVLHVSGSCDKERAISRVRHISTGNPRRLRIVGIAPGDGKAHTMLREWFAAHHINGDWFARHGEIVSYINHHSIPDADHSATRTKVPIGAGDWGLRRLEGTGEGLRGLGGYRDTGRQRMSKDEMKQKILHAHLATGGNTTRAAKLLHVSRRTMVRWIRDFDLVNPVKEIRTARPTTPE